MGKAGLVAEDPFRAREEEQRERVQKEKQDHVAVEMVGVREGKWWGFAPCVWPALPMTCSVLLCLLWGIYSTVPEGAGPGRGRHGEAVVDAVKLLLFAP